MAENPGSGNQVRRGSDELEMLAEVIRGNKGLLQRVLDKIRTLKAMSKMGAFDDVKKKVDEKRKTGK